MSIHMLAVLFPHRTVNFMRAGTMLALLSKCPHYLVQCLAQNEGQ